VINTHFGQKTLRYRGLQQSVAIFANVRTMLRTIILTEV
jgi:hypothetical protein